MAESQAPQQTAAVPAAPAPAAQQQQRSLETIAEHTAETLVAIRDHLQTDVDRMGAANVGYAERLDNLNTGLLEISGVLERIEEEARGQSTVLVHLLGRNEEIEQALSDPALLSPVIGRSVNRALRDVAANVGYAERLDTLNTGLLEISGVLERIEEEARGQSTVLVHLLGRNEEIEQALGDPAHLSHAIGQSVNRALREVIDPIREIYEGEIARQRVERATASIAAGLAREGIAVATFFRDSLMHSLRMVIYWILLCAFSIIWIYPFLVWESASHRVTQEYILNLQNVLVRNPDWRNMLNN
ncbi:uncharacterized protein L3040_006642 [Drepanopeziza brunnea f. sp. 'multigermtubi']|uniref:uncharacterized protein n=1 Tax=Drepanopeziza brunnea f. sp. 'multigermtubi' TaxID=698441 RepID=UPI0023A30910|nr:hypothetical protein L3040_006642 [Drepanopeziza brunnea f. sp. 'multigermtubi']